MFLISIESVVQAGHVYFPTDIVAPIPKPVIVSPVELVQDVNAVVLLECMDGIANIIVIATVLFVTAEMVNVIVHMVDMAAVVNSKKETQIQDLDWEMQLD